MERVLLFDRPMEFDYIASDQKKSEIRMPAYGFQLPDTSYSHSMLSEYLGYLVAAQKWDRLGNDVDYDFWITKEGASYGTFDAETQRFIVQANRELSVSANIYDIEFDLGDGIINDFIVDSALAARIREEGHQADVITSQYEDKVRGV